MNPGNEFFPHETFGENNERDDAPKGVSSLSFVFPSASGPSGTGALPAQNVKY